MRLGRRPAIVHAMLPCAIADHEVLRRHAGGLRDRDGFVGGLGELELLQLEIECARLLRGPRERERRAVDVLADDRAPFGVFDFELLVARAVHVDDFFVLVDRAIAVRRAVAIGMLGDRARRAPSRSCRRSCW